MPEFVDEEDAKVISVTYDGRTREVEVSNTDRVEDIASLYGLDTKQYRFYDENDGELELGKRLSELGGVRIIKDPKGA